MVAPVTPEGRVVHLAVHDASPATWNVLRGMDRVLRQAGVERYAMLVVPGMEGARLDRDPGFCSWLRDLSGAGVDMVLHGLTHSGGTECSRPVDRIRRALFTRGEGEFLCLPEEEAAVRLRRGLSLLEDALGHGVRAFTAPAWLYSRGALAALSRGGFRYAESRWREWDPAAGRTLLRSPVLNFAGGCPARRTAAALWVRAGCRILARAPAVRLALHPADFGDPTVKAGTVRVLEGLLERARAASPVPAPGGTREGENTYNTVCTGRPREGRRTHGIRSV